MKEKNNISTSIDAVKVFISVIKILGKVGIKGKFLGVMKNIYEKHMVLNREQLSAFYLQRGTR